MTYWYGAAAALLVGFSKTGVPGAAIPAVALMAEAFRAETKLSVGALLPVLLVGDAFALAYYRRHACWRRLGELFPYVAAGMAPGYLVLWRADADSLRVFLGLLILGLLVVQAGRLWLGWSAAPNRWWFPASAGALAGFGTAVGNAAGPVMSIYLVSKGLEKREFLGTAAWFFFLVNVSKIPWFALLGVISPATLRFDVLLVPAVVAGALAGAAALRRIPQAAFNGLVLFLAAAAAVRMVFF